MSIRSLLLLALAGCGGGAPSDVLDPIDPAVCSDDDAPVIACPESIAVNCASTDGAPVEFEVSAETCDAQALAVSCTHASGSELGLGEHTIECTATDSRNGEQSDCSFVATIETGAVPVLTCAPPIARECTGFMTEVAVPSPTAIDGCGGTIDNVESDQPESYPLGVTTVTFYGSSTDGAEATCATPVTIADTAPPEVDCGEPIRIVRATREDAISLPSITAMDLCDPAPVVAITPAITERGSHVATLSATDHGGLRNECELLVEVLDVFAPTDLHIISARLATDGETDVTLAWNASTGEDTAGYQIERAADAAGPWTILDVVPLDTYTYTDGSVPFDQFYYRLTAVSAMGEPGGSSEPVKGHTIAATTYDLRTQSVPTVPFATTLYGVVRHPSTLTTGPYPLVVMIHGNHGICRASPTSSDDVCGTSDDHECPFDGWFTTPNAEGMTYLAETLAAQGFIAVTISANALNCRDDYIPERTQLLLEHIRRWKTWNEGSAAPFADLFRGRVDMSRVSVVGHSRGGEAVSGAPAALRETPIAGVILRSVFAIAPVDVHGADAPGVDYAVLLPSCDGDVSTLEGMHIYDRALESDDPGRRAQVLYSGANHNFFNTEWRVDDGSRVCSSSEMVGSPAQRAMLESVLGAWLRATVLDADVADYILADADRSPAIDAWAARELDLRWSYASPTRVGIDQFEGADAPTRNLLGGSNAFTGFRYAFACTEQDCGQAFRHDKSGVLLSWEAAGASAQFGFGALDASAYEALSFRIVSRQSIYNSDVTDQDFLVRVIDAHGAEASVLLSEVRPLRHGYITRTPRDILQTGRIHVGDLLRREPTFDASAIASLEFVMNQPAHARGSILVTDIELAGD